MFTIELTLMRIASATIVTAHLASPANAVKSLVDNNAIAAATFEVTP